MFKLPGAPSPSADLHELADFMELHAWREGAISEQRICDALGRDDDNEVQDGVESSDDDIAAKLEEVMLEIERRVSACDGAYPFNLDRVGTVLRHNAADQSVRKEVYRYLLLATRLNMTEHDTHAGIDGTELLEEVSACALRGYLGADRAQSLVFGTSATGSFKERVDQLIYRVGEGGRFKGKNTDDLQPADAKLDVIAWVPFADSLPSKVVIFGQCKTGTNWKGELTQLQPDKFTGLWMTNPFCHVPSRAFCIAEAASQTRWHHDATYAGILFDRCRLAGLSFGLDADLFERVQTWSAAAISSFLLPARITPRRNARS